MGKPHPPVPALLFTGILYSENEYFEKTKKTLLDLFGPSLMETSPVNWDHSDYYKEELGSPIKRIFIFFRNLINHEDIVDIKLKTNSIEDSLSADGKRRVNIDPGYLTLANVVLATTKGYSHRIYLGKGIYGEVSLLYREKDRTFIPHIFTYQDYLDKNCIDMFIKAREFLKLKKERK
ncbi:MAG: DUF4416 family protein [Thermodesulfovibrionales bacterium]|nr:DUF4416 family protein [Thermodesulfovibrionales bacterium]